MSNTNVSSCDAVHSKMARSTHNGSNTLKLYTKTDPMSQTEIITNIIKRHPLILRHTFANSHGHLQCRKDPQEIIKANQKGKLPDSKEAPFIMNQAQLPLIALRRSKHFISIPLTG